jgi:hypothetical protein
VATADYNSATITVATRTLKLASEGVSNLVLDVAHRLEAIMHTLDHLSLSWIGSSASEAKDFGDRWSATMVELFGKPTDGAAGGKASPAGKQAGGHGVLGTFAAGLAIAAGNYDTAEDKICEAFRRFVSIGSGSGSGAESAPPSINDGGKTAISEVFPS